jgi:hypothetical protein
LSKPCIIVFASGRNLVIKISQHLSHEVILSLGSVSNQSLAFPLSETGKRLGEQENKRNFTALGLTSFMRIILHISVNVFKCIPASSEVEPHQIGLVVPNLII